MSDDDYKATAEAQVDQILFHATRTGRSHVEAMRSARAAAMAQVMAYFAGDGAPPSGNGAAGLVAEDEGASSNQADPDGSPEP